MFEVRGGSDKALLSEIGEVILDGIRRILQARADLAHGGAEEARREVELIAQEFIGMLCINVERRQNGLRKVFQVLRHDHVAAADDRRRENVTIVFIGQGKRRDERLIAGDKAIARMPIHQVTGALQDGTIAMRLIAKERFDPFAMNVGAPFRAVQIRDCELQKNIPHGGGIEDVGVEKRGVPS